MSMHRCLGGSFASRAVHAYMGWRLHWYGTVVGVRLGTRCMLDLKRCAAVTKPLTNAFGLPFWFYFLRWTQGGMRGVGNQTSQGLPSTRKERELG